MRGIRAAPGPSWGSRRTNGTMVKSWCPTAGTQPPPLCYCHAHSQLSTSIFKPDGITREEWRYFSESRVLCSLLVAPEFTFMEKSCQGCACHINISSSCIMQSVCSSQMLKQLKTFKFSAKCTLRVICTDCNVSCFN